MAGRAVSLALAIGPASRIFTRALYADASAAPFWDGDFPVSEAVAEDLAFLASSRREEFCTPIFPSPSSPTPVFFAVDASVRGWGALRLSTAATNVPAHGFFSAKERAESSTHRELRGLLGCLRAFLTECRGSALCIHVDNQNVDRVTRNGLSRPGLATLAKDIFALCRAESITLSVSWVPREFNTEADDLSKLFDVDEWR